MVEEMAELKGKMVLGADWQLAVHYGRGETRNQILAKKDDPTMSPIYFAQNYESKWVGAVDSALVKINKVMELRTLTKAEHKGEDNFDYIISFDVARSQSQSNNKSVITVFKLIKNKKNQIKQIHLVNILVPPNGTSFFQQTLLLKKVQVLYNAIAVVIDSNGIGSAVVDYALQETIDPVTNEVYDAWATMNTDRQSDDPLAKELIFEINAQGMNTDIIVNFMDVIESGRLRLLVRENEVNIDFKMSLEELNPFIQTDLLIEELANLTLKKLPSGKYTVEQVTKKVDKDRYSALAYGLYYIVKVYEPSLVTNEAPDITRFLFIN
jgi:ribonucleoside-diphosphate reductase alpha chain